MKGVWLLLFLSLFLLPLSVTATEKKEVEKPCFVAATTQKLEILKVVLTDERTRLDAVMYGTPGDLAIISDKTCLHTAAGDYAVCEAEHVSIGGFTQPGEIPESGRLRVSLFFPPLPANVRVVDFMDKEDGWCIYGLQLTGIEPYVFVPDFLLALPQKAPSPIDEPQINPGKSIVNGYVLGYDPGMKLDATFKLSDWLTYNGVIHPLKIHPDGSFHVEADLLLPTCARIQLGAAWLDVLLLPGKEFTVHIHLPRFSMSHSRTLAHKVEKEPSLWFDGEYTPCECDYASYRARMEETNRALCEDIRKARSAYLSLRGNPKAETGLSGISSASVREYVKRRVAAAAEEERRAKAVNGYVVAEVDTTLRGKELLSALVASGRGHVMLVDFWATWCAPCLRSMQAIGPIKKRLSQSDIIYIYVTGASSPEHRWASMIHGISGIHYRLTNAQWNELCSMQGVTGIPAYLIFDDEGRLRKKFIGFPGTDVLSQELLRAGR